MKVHKTDIPDLLILEPKVNKDHRGFFLETWRESWLQELGMTNPFIQDNHARSTTRGVLRGMHFQTPPHTQTKLVWASAGAIFDVAVDLRASSPTYGQWFGVELSSENFLRLFVPKGFAHGYVTLTDICEVQYKVDNYYNPESDSGLLWNDPDIGIKWPVSSPVLSDKDSKQPLLKNFSTPFA